MNPASFCLSLQEGDYGSFRKWGAVGWGVTSTIAGAIIAHMGMLSAFMLNILLSLPCLYVGWRLHTLCTHHQKGGHGSGVRAAGRQRRQRTQLEPVMVRREGGGRIRSIPHFEPYVLCVFEPCMLCVLGVGSVC